MTRPYDIDRWSRVLVYGLGLSGRAAVRLLLERGRDDLRVLGVDARPAADLDLAELAELIEAGRFEVRAGDEPGRLPEKVDAVVVSPGVPLDRPLLDDARGAGVPVLAEVELAYPFLEAPIVAVTGSNGKSTTTALAGAMLRAAGFDARVCGNIGEPLSAQVARPEAEGDSGTGTGSGGARGRVYVVELSSFQLSAIQAFRPRAAAFLNLAADHLDRHGTLEGYAEAKRRIFENQRPASAASGEGDVAVLNADDPIVAATAVPGRRRLFSRAGEVEDGCFLREERVIERVPEGMRSAGVSAGETELFAADHVPLEGAHNLADAMAAALLARALGVSPEELRRGLAGFRGLPHRMERVAEAGGVTWYDDSKGTNPAATLGCLEGFNDGSVHLILGGRNKGNDFSVLAPAVARKARRVYLIGEAAAEIERALTGAISERGETGQGPVPISRSGSVAEAVREAAERARAGDAVLLSPACASFDQFRDFNERGDVFQRFVRAVHLTEPGGAVGQKAGV